MADQSRQSDKEHPHVEAVQIEGLVALKIIRHCYEEGPSEIAQGVLLGLVVDKKLEITNCFPFPRSEDDESSEVQYQMEMMRKLREVNVDHLHVGWYQSTYLGSFLNKNFVEAQYNYQSSIEESVVLVYDPLKTLQGMLSFKAYRLTPLLMELYRSGEKAFTPDGLAKRGVSYDNLFEEVPVIIKNSNLACILLCEIEEMSNIKDKDSFLSLATGSYLEKSVQLLMEGADELCQDAQKLHNYQRNNSRQQQQIDGYKAKRAAENDQRIKRGEQPLPEEDMTKVFRPIPPPSRLDNTLVNSQINNYCQELTQFASQSFTKLYMAEAIQSTQQK
ncbi:eukaryotic translation initiation factor 3 subunit H-like [Rhopilema esculentum]|uniref:eukaryotic translation initiation factor 3 subunit H-like n=1 Tax=Rhopilema esculentum TaxID=499914 RepID=UPI0031CF4561|eukprot:gene7801-13664_t